MAGLLTYDAKPKDRWREWLWDSVARLARGGGVVLYLCGPDDRDRYPALARLGCNTHDMIAVDADAQCVKSLRQAGKNVIHDDLGEVVASWPSHTPLRAIIADFCGGLTKATHQFLLSLVSSAAVIPDTVIAVNLLRGRDGGDLLSRVRDGIGMYPVDVGDDPLLNDSGSIHRGSAFTIEYINTCLAYHMAMMPRSERRRMERSTRRWEKILERINAHMAVEAMEYPSGHQWFDSAVFRAYQYSADARAGMFKTLGIQGMATNPKVSAALAVRTSRLGVSSVA